MNGMHMGDLSSSICDIAIETAFGCVILFVVFLQAGKCAIFEDYIRFTSGGT